VFSDTELLWFLLYSLAFSDSALIVLSDNTILAAELWEAAVPFGLFFDPFIRSERGAGVWAADFLPLRYGIVAKFSQI
jgi:hypothetical protein